MLGVVRVDGNVVHVANEQYDKSRIDAWLAEHGHTGAVHYGYLLARKRGDLRRAFAPANASRGSLRIPRGWDAARQDFRLPPRN